MLAWDGSAASGGDNGDLVAAYGRSRGWSLCSRSILVEGSTDVGLVELAATLEREESGVDLLGGEMVFVAAGEGEDGGTRGVNRELICLRGLSRTSLLFNGKPRYRFVGLFDNDKAGREAIRGIRNIDRSILEYRDVFRIMPEMPRRGNRDVRTLKTSFERHNLQYRGLDWELEDLISSDLVEAYLAEHPAAVHRLERRNEKIHREFTWDGKARLHRFVRKYAIRKDLEGVIDMLRAMRFYCGLRSL